MFQLQVVTFVSLSGNWRQTLGVGEVSPNRKALRVI